MSTNLSEMQNLVSFLREQGQIPLEGGAVVQIALSLAEAVDLDPNNASLWREYRLAEQAVREIGTADSSEMEALIAALRAPISDEKDEPAHSRTPSGGNS